MRPINGTIISEPGHEAARGVGAAADAPVAQWRCGVTCEVCDLGPAPEHGGVTVFRVNPVGVLPARWRCVVHLDTPIDPEVADLVTVLEQGRLDRS
jgi:hypothetical protein